MNLWVDDKIPMPSGYDVHARNSETAINLLPLLHFDTISFGDNGYELAVYFQEESQCLEYEIVEWKIHTNNQPTRNLIYDCLNRADANWLGHDQKDENDE